MQDYREFYLSSLEPYLFNKVRSRFLENGYLSAFDFFCIIIWKANRSKSKIAKALVRKRESSLTLEAAVKELTKGVRTRELPAEKMRFLMKDWGLRLPMASAILTVLYPDEFTVYDDRVRNVLGCQKLENKLKFESIWAGYREYKRRVETEAPVNFCLRDKDRYLWGKSFHDDLIRDLKQEFKKQKPSSD